MKLQDILFFIILIMLLLIKQGKYCWHAGMVSLLLAGVLFTLQNLFTSQRLSWYAWAFLTIAIIRQIIINIKQEK